MRPYGRPTGAALPPNARRIEAEGPEPGITVAWFTRARSGNAGRTTKKNQPLVIKEIDEPP
jgi:hypothetical protein